MTATSSTHMILESAGQLLAERDTQIERLKTDNDCLRRNCAQLSELNQQRLKLKKLIAELADVLESRIDWPVEPLRGDLLQRAREAAS